MFSLVGKKALVTGSSRGIGRGIALALAAQGADVVVNYRGNIEQANVVVEEIKRMGRNAIAIQADVSKSDEVTRMFEEVKSQWGSLNILVNNAGIVAQNPIEKITEDEWSRIIDTNLKGQFLCIQKALPLLAAGSRIVCISSIASGGVGVGFGNIAHYAASKGGVIGMVEDLAIEFGPRGININAIAPGIIESDMTTPMLSSPEQKAGLTARIPKRRIGRPADIAAAAAFLSSDEADYITGTVIYVDGGWLAG
ncbi:3-oxoacyl-ACP reductase FabG [bacterium]|nr:MAG: 3-oxoacyl-ACP reductase FabG [bacterium]